MNVIHVYKLYYLTHIFYTVNNFANLTATRGIPVYIRRSLSKFPYKGVKFHALAIPFESQPILLLNPKSVLEGMVATIRDDLTMLQRDHVRNGR